MDLAGKEWVEVFASANPAQISAVRSAFTNENIDFTVQGELTLGHRGCVTAAHVFVLRPQEGRALAVLSRVAASLES